MILADAVGAATGGAFRDRMTEFAGSAAYITGSDGSFDAGGEPSPLAELPRYLASGLEISRSLWDRELLIADVDLEHHNFDNPASAWQDPASAFRLQQPVFSETLQILQEAGVRPLVLLSGRGFHLVWSIRQDSEVFARLVRLGTLTSALGARYAGAVSPSGLLLSSELGCAFAGLGKLMEFLFHETFQRTGERPEIPMKPAAIEVGLGTRGREIVSFDLSEYGDPLHFRRIRVPFSAYLKPRQWKWMLGEEAVERLSTFFEIPLEIDPLEAIAIARDPQAVSELAARVSMQIPDASEGTANLLDRYQQSSLAAFHAAFEADLRLYGSFSAGPPPIPPAAPCLRYPFDQPNDWLLRPGVLQHVTRVLDALGWRTSAIAHVIAAGYRRDCNWGNTWERLEPDSRALFYTRLFAGMIATGIDKLIDMNCVSHREKGFCLAPDCRGNLATVRTMLKQRRRT